jgi:hypothetical protein
MESPSASVIEAFVATPFDYIVIGADLKDDNWLVANSTMYPQVEALQA